MAVIPYHGTTSRSSLRLQNASSRCWFAYKVLVCCERGDYNFCLIGSNNASSDINFYYYDYNYVDNEQIKCHKNNQREVRPA